MARIRLLTTALVCLACDGGLVSQTGSQPSAKDASANDALANDASVNDGGPDAGTPSDAAGVPPPGGKLFELLDDMEGGKANLATPVGLASWFTAPADPSKTAPGQWEIADADSPRDRSLTSQHVNIGAPGTIDLRIDIHGPNFQGGGPPYPDLGGYAAVAFWARGGSDTALLQVAIEDDQVVAGRSNYVASRASAKPWFEHAVTLSSEWRRHILLFDDFRQPEHPDAKLNTHAVWSVHFVGGLEGTGVEFWLDDLALLCRGSCPPPTWDVYPVPGPGMDDRSLPWAPGQGSTVETTCAVIAPLSLAPLPDVSANVLEKVLLRVRIPVDPAPAVPLWAWSVEDVASGAKLDVIPIDDHGATVALPITAAGRYRVLAHSHYPATSVCGVETYVEAH